MCDTLLENDPLEKIRLKRELGRTAFEAKTQPLLDDALEQLMGYFQPPPPDVVGRMETEARRELEALGYGGEVDEGR